MKSVVMKRDMVSIILPAHNAEDTISEAIQSALLQDYIHWQLIIIENGSQDRTLTLCHQFKDPRIIIISDPTPGLSRARNIGMDQAQGEFICFLDADDTLPPQSLRLRVELLQKHLDIAYCDGQVIKKNEQMDRVLEVWHPRIPENLHLEMNKINACCFCGVTWMIRSSALGSKRFDETWSHLEDRKFFFELSQAGLYSAVENPIYIIRKRRGSLMTNHRKLQAAYKRFLNFVKEQNQINVDEIREQHLFYKLMFFKTHLKTGRFLAACRVLLEKQ